MAGVCFHPPVGLRWDGTRIAGAEVDPTRTFMVGLPDPDSAGEVGLLTLGELVWRSSGDRGRAAVGTELLQLGLLPADALVAACHNPEPFEWALRTLEAAVGGGWHKAGWHLAPDAWKAAAWPQAAPEVVRGLRGWGNRSAEVPVRDGRGGLRIVPGHMLGYHDAGVSQETLFPPTEAGWREFVEAARASGLKWGELDRAAAWWWRRRMPKGLGEG